MIVIEKDGHRSSLWWDPQGFRLAQGDPHASQITRFSFEEVIDALADLAEQMGLA